MHFIFISWLTVYICNAQDDNMTSTMDMGMTSTVLEMDFSTTEFHTTTKAPEECAPDLTNMDDMHCLFESNVLVFHSESETAGESDIYVTVCGVDKDAHDEEEGEHAHDHEDVHAEDIELLITAKVPADRWFGIGFTDPDVVADPMVGYAIIIPICSRDIIELDMTGKVASGTAPGTELASSLTVVSDVVADGFRTIMLKRPLKITVDDIATDDDGTNLQNVNDGKYFDFSPYMECQDEFDVFYAQANLDNVVFSRYVYHGMSGRGTGTLVIEKTGEMECEDDDSSANGFFITFVIFIIGFVVVLV